DEGGSLFPPQTEHTLGNLTKSRPRNTRRRSPSPLARRKFEDDHNSGDLSVSVLEKESIQKPLKHYRDNQGAHNNLFKERVGIAPSPISDNDVGLVTSISSDSVERSSQKLRKASPPKVAPKPDRRRIGLESPGEERISDIDGEKITTENYSIKPPPLPTSPPPLDKESAIPLNIGINEENTSKLQGTTYSKATKREDESNFDYNLSTKLNTTLEIANQVAESRKGINNDLTTSFPKKGSTGSRIAKWQGLRGQTGNSFTFETTNVADDSQDSAITMRLSKYETPYSSRHRKLPSKSQSSHRRRFKPVSLPSETKTIMHEGELCEPEAAMDSSRYQDKLLDEKQIEKSSGDYFINYDDKKLADVNVEDCSPGTGRRLNGESEKNNSTIVENCIPKRFDVSLTSNPEPIVLLERNVSNESEKAVEVEINETLPVVLSEMQASKTRVNDSQSNILDNTKNSNQDCRNSLTPKQQDSAGMTLPKVVIQYDNGVLSDGHWYDSETSNEEAANSRSSIVGLQNKSVMQRNYSESDISLQADSDNVMDYEDGEEDLELGLDDVSSGDEDLTFEDLEYARAQMERAKGIDDLGSNQNSDNGLSDQSTRQDVIELTEADIEERDETLLQPPPMFASSDEVETEDLGEVHERENAFEFHTPSPVIPSSLLVQQPRDFKRFHNLALEVWTEEDCVDWLDYIGLGHFSPQFRENHVDGMMLKNINFQLLEEIGIDSPDEREVMLSEIYRRFHPEEEDMFEMEIQGALQSASEQERMKIMAVLNALRSPAFQAELGIAPSTGPSSPHDSYASESGSISSGMTGGSDDHYHDLAMPPPPPPPTSSQTRRSSEKDDNVCSSAMIHPAPAEIFYLILAVSFAFCGKSLLLFQSGAHHELLGSDCPLLFQCRWQDPDKHRFELRCKNEGVIKMLFELEGYEDDLDYRSIPLSSKTPCSEAVPLIVKKFNLPGEDCDYLLVEVSEENEDDREEVAGHVCPLRLQMAWSAPDHVFRLCRRPNEELGTNEDSKEIMLDGWTTDATDDVALERETQSELSSAQEENDQDVTPAKLGAVERDEIVEETREDLMDGLARLDSVIEEESEAIASQEILKLKRELMEKKVELQELQVKTAKIMAEKESEIERLLEENKQLRHGELNEVNVRILNLEKENEELKATAENFHEMKRKDDVLTVNESELHSLRLRNEELRKEAQGIEEKFKTEISLRDREIERLYARNNELASKEKELDSVNEEKSSLLAFDLQQKELEKVKLLRDEASASQSEMTSKLEALQTRNNDLEAKIAQIENLTQVNRELCQKVDEGEIIRQEFQRSEAEKKDLKAKLESLNSERKKSEQSIAEELENLREKNQFLSDQCKDADEMKKNIIKLTAQLREMEKKNQCEADSLQRKLEEFTSEKQLLHKRIAELEKTENGGEQADISQKEGEDLKLENIFLVERTREVEELKASVAKFAAEARENESFKQKYKELRDVESYLTKQVNTAETIARQKDKKLKESENKINTLTEAVKDMEAKLEEQEQNQHYLDQLLTMLKDRDPTLLHVINSSLASKYES
ncbi:PREDICTED: uncharacterized protein LOC107351721, partial [Acropora digitifera]|uniref:uncharacterized protein LOC107351721 n=1 Tax=Acropora digitifera TaxID=70779 RepID=UPI00077AAAB5